MAGVSALTGVVASHDGHRRLGFSIVVNGPLATDRSKRLQDQIVLALLDHVER